MDNNSENRSGSSLDDVYKEPTYGTAGRHSSEERAAHESGQYSARQNTQQRIDEQTASSSSQLVNQQASGQQMSGAQQNSQQASMNRQSATYQQGYSYGASQRYTGQQYSDRPTGAQPTGQSVNRRTPEQRSSAYNPYAGEAEHRANQTQAANQTSTKPKNVKRAKKKSSFGGKLLKTAAIALVFGLVAGGAFQGVKYGTDYLVGDSGSGSSDGSISSTSTVSTDSSTTTVSYDVAEIVEATETSVVSITTTVTETIQYFFQTYEQDSTGAGSGIIIGETDDLLYIVTNYHVIEGANEINVGFVDESVATATVVGYDSDSDVALVAVNLSDLSDETKSSISIASIGDSDSIQVGEPAIAIGNALGYGQSVTVGYISALDRTVSDSDMKFIQTDAAINPGNSGGALINAEGQVIGINSVKYVDSTVEGMGFAIPINDVMEIVEDILSGKTDSSEAYLGISGVDITSEYSQIYGFPEGIYVKEVTTDSGAYTGGLQAGDIIVEFDGTEVYTIEDLQELIENKQPGDTVSVVVYRADRRGSYEKTTVSVTLGTKTD